MYCLSVRVFSNDGLIAVEAFDSESGEEVIWRTPEGDRLYKQYTNTFYVASMWFDTYVSVNEAVRLRLAHKELGLE